MQLSWLTDVVLSIEIRKVSGEVLRHSEQRHSDPTKWCDRPGCGFVYENRYNTDRPLNPEKDVAIVVADLIRSVPELDEAALFRYLTRLVSDKTREAIQAELTTPGESVVR